MDCQPASGRKYTVKEVSGEEWQCKAPFIEQQNYLLRQDGGLRSSGQAVVFVKEGYYEQCKAVGEPQLDPRWTSHALRRRQARSMSNRREALREKGVGQCPLGLVEDCRVLSMRFFCRTPEDAQRKPLMPRESASQAASHLGMHVRDLAAIEAAVLQDSRREVVEALLPPAPEAAQSEDLGLLYGSEDQYYVQIVLQKTGVPSAAHPHTPTLPLCTVLEHFLDCGVGEWLIPRERYEAAQVRKWRRGDRIQMFWADPDSHGHGDMWEGVVVGRIDRHEDDPAWRGSPWEAIEVRWDETGDNSIVSMWELTSPDAPLYRDTAEEIWVYDSDPEASLEAGKGLAFLVDKGELEEGGRQCKRARSGKWSTDASSESSQDAFEPRAPKRVRPHAPRSLNPNMPETMQRLATKMDWNAGHCAACKRFPDGSLVIACDGKCLRSFHWECLPEDLRPHNDEAEGTLWFCPDCRVGRAVCTACAETGRAGREVFKCKMGTCGRYFHPACLRHLATDLCFRIHKDIGEASGSNGRTELVFTCPHHYCQRCHTSGDSMKLMRCWKCPCAYHVKCLDKGDIKLDQKEIECVNCSSGASLTQPATPYSAPLPPLPVKPRAGAAPTVPASGKARRRDREKAGGQGAQAASQAVHVNTHVTSLPRLTHLEENQSVDLTGKEVFHLGTHTKGGGCDFLVPTPNIKFHSALKARDIACVSVLKRDGARQLLDFEPMALEHGDVFLVAGATFLFEQVFQVQTAAPGMGFHEAKLAAF